MPKEIRDRGLDAFASNGKQPGVGLGLAICREIVKAHGGSIAADLARERGCVFRVGASMGNSVMEADVEISPLRTRLSRML